MSPLLALILFLPLLVVGHPTPTSDEEGTIFNGIFPKIEDLFHNEANAVFTIKHKGRHHDVSPEKSEPQVKIPVVVENEEPAVEVFPAEGDGPTTGSPIVTTAAVKVEIVVDQELIGEGHTPEVHAKRTKLFEQTLGLSQYSGHRELLKKLKNPQAHPEIGAITSLSVGAVSQEAKKAWEAINAVNREGDKPDYDAPTIRNVNKDIEDLLIGDQIYSNDVIDEILAVGRGIVGNSSVNPLASAANPRIKRQLIKLDSWGGADKSRRWDKHGTICYTFAPEIEDYTRHLIQLAAQFWTDNTCITWQECATGSPVIKFFKGQGCYSNVGKDRGRGNFEQQVSIGNGCELFGTIAHEMGHVLGYFHHQSRRDRDNNVTIMSNVIEKDWLPQYWINWNSENENIPYDYGSVMHYTGYRPHTDVIEMMAKDKRFQHTMGNNYGPVFSDLLGVNRWYGCEDFCPEPKISCGNDGIVNPRNCSQCICPNGFAGNCLELQPAEHAPSEYNDCSKYLRATDEWQTLEGAIEGIKAGPKGIAEREAGCHYHINGDDGLVIEINVTDITITCTPECYYGSLEIKFKKDFIRSGMRICCKSHPAEVGVISSEGSKAVVSAYSLRDRLNYSLQYRQAAYVPPPAPPCEDTDIRCTTQAGGIHCNRALTKKLCRKTCNLC